MAKLKTFKAFTESVVVEGLFKPGDKVGILSKSSNKQFDSGIVSRVEKNGDIVVTDTKTFSSEIVLDPKFVVKESIMNEGGGNQFLIIKDGKQVKGFKTWSGAKKYVEANKGYSTDDIQSAEWYHDHKNESVSLFEGGMSDVYIVAQEAKDEASFLKDFFKEFGDKVKKTTASVKWAKEIYADALKSTPHN